MVMVVVVDTCPSNYGSCQADDSCPNPFGRHPAEEASWWLKDIVVLEVRKSKAHMPKT